MMASAIIASKDRGKMMNPPSFRAVQAALSSCMFISDRAVLALCLLEIDYQLDSIDSNIKIKRTGRTDPSSGISLEESLNKFPEVPLHPLGTTQRFQLFYG